MLSIAHASVGAFVASKIPNPLVYVPVTIALHFLADRVPHWDAGEGMNEGRRTKKAAFWIEIVDLILTAGIIWWLWLRYFSIISIVTLQNPLAWHILIGALAGLIPDLIEAPRIFFGTELKIFKPINHLHEKFHRTTSSRFWGLLPQALILILIWIFK